MEEGDCVVCGRNVHDQSGLLDFYQLSHTYMVLRPDRTAEVAAPGTGRDLTVCSARCLCAFVAEKIAPDARSEE